jgi:erythromycin esterase-like protein
MGNALSCFRNKAVPVGYNFFRIQMDGTIHDMQMASNLGWLARNKYPGRKIIVWSNNQHVSKHTSGIDVEFSDYRKTQKTTMGNEISRSFGDSAFIIGFTSSEGTSGSPFQRNMKPFPLNSTNGKDVYAKALMTTKHAFAFTNFRALQLDPVSSSSFTMRGWGYTYPMEGQWFKVFDGIFYIRRNAAAKALEVVEFE